MAHWQAIQYAPKDGREVRVLVGHGKSELIWKVRWADGCWRYATTGNPLHSWHEPLEWTAEPYTEEEYSFFVDARNRAYGSLNLPSMGNKNRPRLALVRP